ncbi:hypothetical protein NA56DRAFT_594944 [Hyaloscypha hepaticicola]|uniref:DUF7702 domain-containing protein n=1 Tax=Hyaloscypha hepaticicola TaxID=2082293 RepID=A0A2J6QEE6_9HELO|nr:hypothetical protein NA56DRAFT_594944 [Hyaloscypha hepaticicola]
MVSTAQGIAYSELVVYIPVFLLTAIIIFRHGFQKQLGWIYLTIFCVIQIAGAIFEIKREQSPTNKTDIEWAEILQSVGLSPLLMASLGLLKRVTDEVSNHVRSMNNSFLPTSGIANIVTKRATANSRRSRIIQIAQLLTMIALILCIAGGIDEAGSKLSEGQKLTKIGIAIFAVIYVLLFALSVITMKDVGNAPREEKRIYMVVLIALPLIAVRLLWSILSAFGQSSDFSLNSPKPLIQLFMATVEEFIVVVCYTTVGLLI